MPVSIFPLGQTAFDEHDHKCGQRTGNDPSHDKKYPYAYPLSVSLQTDPAGKEKRADGDRLSAPTAEKQGGNI